MNVVVVGPGALGSVIGAMLSRAGHEVSLLGRPSPHLRALQEHGLLFTDRSDTTELIQIAATDNPAVVVNADWLVVLVKSGDTGTAMETIAPHVDSGQVIVTLQNGLGNAERIRAIFGEGPRVLPGTTSQAATRIAPGAVVHAGEGPTLIGFMEHADEAVARQIAGVFTDSGLPAAATPDIERWVWYKVAINAAINGLTAVGGFTNGAIAEDPNLLASAEILAEEVASVARANGIELGNMRRAVLETVVATAHNRSSMLQDLEAGRRTEVAAIHGAILAAGADAGIDTPAMRVMAALIGAKEQLMSPETVNDG